MNLLKWARSPTNPMKLVELPDYDMLLDSEDDTIAAYLLNHGTWEPKSTAVFKDWIKPGDTMIDCGAHWGYYTLLAASWGVNVYSFEANPASYRLLNLNLALNEPYLKTTFAKVMTIPLAVWYKTGLLNFLPETANSGGSHVTAEVISDLKNYGGILVPCVSLDEVFDKEKIDLIKIDCEGSDGFVLSGAKRLLSEQRPKLIIERPTPEFLKEVGYIRTHNFTDEQTTFWEKT